MTMLRSLAVAGRIVTAGCGTGLMLVLPIAFGDRFPVLGLLVLVAFVPLLALPLTPTAWAAAGAFAATCLAGSLTTAFIAKSAALSLIAPFTVALPIVLSLAFGAWLARRRELLAADAVLLSALAWLVVASTLDELGAPIVPLSTGLTALEGGPALASRALGVPALDSLCMLTSAAVGCAFARRLRLPAGIAVLWAVATVVGSHTSSTSSTSSAVRGEVPVHVVQPRVATDDFRAAGWSLAQRELVAQRYERLTREAVRRGAGVVIWPEGGTGAPDLQLLPRRRELQALFGPEKTNALIATSLIGERGRYNGAGIVRGGRVEALTFKSRLVPIAESQVSPGRSRVLETDFGPAGVLICFDSVFAGVSRALAEQGAHVLVLTTDDASFGHSTATYGHILVTRLRALSLGLPLVVASNFGPSIVVDHLGREEARLPYGERGVLTAAFERGGSGTLASGALRWFAPVVALAWLLLLLRPLRTSRRCAPSSLGLAVGRAVLGVSCAASIGLVVGVLSEGVFASLRDGQPATAVWGRLAKRDSPPRAVEGLGPAFRQSAKETCGAAALAFALTHMGHTTTEEELRRACLLPAGLVSLEMLARCAGLHGMRAEGLEANFEYLRTLSAETAILHVSENHFVTVLDANEDAALIFDPARGALLSLPRIELQGIWSGRALRVRYESPFATAASIRSAVEPR